ncbi:MAG: hypothetical protein R2731_07965 [Nocardioides sp.]
MVFGKRDDRDPVDRALAAAAGYRVGSWESVQAYAMLAIEAAGRPGADELYEQALDASRRLASGSWESIRADLARPGPT